METAAPSSGKFHTMKPTLLATALIGVTALLVGCNGGGETAKTDSTSSGGSAPTSGKKLKIAVIPKGSTHEYWKSLHEGANKAADELGNVEIEWKGPIKEDDRDSQVQTVEGFVATKVDGIVLAPLDDKALVKPVQEAADAGIPTVVIDSPLQDGNKAVSLVATDNAKGGMIAAQELAKLLGDKGKVIVLKYQEGSASTMLRESGFFDEMKKHPGITVVAQEYGGVTSDSAQSKAENMIQPLKAGDRLSIDGIYAVNESTTFGMLLALQDAKVAGKVKFVGFDASPKLIDGLKAGEIDGLIVQDPRKMGYLGVKAIVDKINGKSVEAKVDTGVTFVTKTSMTTPDVAALIAPPKI